VSPSKRFAAVLPFIPYQSTDPTLSSVTPPAEQEARSR
jgi:hypothetical protein